MEDDDDEMMLAKQQKLFVEEKEEDWECQKVKSPAGTWYIVKNEADRDVYERPTQKGRRRAVFSRNELFNAQNILKSSDKENCQEWLSMMILIKTSIPGARIESTRKKSS
jgi:hypothetical protein